MTYFRFTDTEHQLTLRERETMRTHVMSALVGAPVSRVGVISLMPLLAVCARLLAMPSVMAALSVVLVVGVGSRVYMSRTQSSSAVVAAQVQDATTLALQALETPRAAPAGVSSTISSFAADTTATMARTTSPQEAVPKEVAEALTAIDTVLTSSSNVSEIPLARVVASLARLQSAAETNIENGVGLPADDAVLTFIQDKKPLLTLLTIAASDEEKLAIHTAAAEDVLADVQQTDDTGRIFAEAWLAANTAGPTPEFIDDLATARAVAVR